MAKRRTILEQVNFFLWLWNTILTIGVVFFMLRYKLRVEDYFSAFADLLNRVNWLRFILEKWRSIILGALFLTLFIAMGRDNKSTSEIGTKLFTPHQMPQTWGRVPTRWIYWWIVTANIIMFLGMLWFVDNVLVFATLLGLFYSQAIVWMVQIRKAARSYFDNPNYKPPSGDRHASFIQRRRQAVEEYLFRRPHIARETFNATSCLVAGVVAFLGQTWDLGALNGAAHLILVTAVFVNEYIVGRWRRARNRVIADIDDDQTDADAKHVGED